MKTTKLIILATLATVLIISTGIVVAQPQQPTLQERVTAIKASLPASQTNLRTYQWIQTTVVSVKGDEKSNKQELCYYGADGTLQKVEINASPPLASKPGIRGEIMAKKEAEMTDYMKNAVALVKSYVPPDPAKLQASLDAGNVSVNMVQPGKRASIIFENYLKPGDSLGVDIDLVNNLLLSMTLFTYLSDPKSDAITLVVQMGQLNDGTIFPANITLNAQSKSVIVTVQNSGYKKATQVSLP